MAIWIPMKPRGKYLALGYFMEEKTNTWAGLEGVQVCGGYVQNLIVPSLQGFHCMHYPGSDDLL